VKFFITVHFTQNNYFSNFEPPYWQWVNRCEFWKFYYRFRISDSKLQRN